ncbi:MAG: hypothetical protein ACPL7D_01795 [Candidatus Sumerlaeaceae bacterium]
MSSVIIAQNNLKTSLRAGLIGAIVGLVVAMTSAQEMPSAPEAQATAVFTTATASAQKADSSSTAPVFVPPEVEGVGGRWIIPEETKGEMAVRSIAPSEKQEPAAPPSATPSPTPRESTSLSRPSRSAQENKEQGPPRRTPRQAEREDREVGQSDTESSQESQEAEVPPRPKWVTVSGKVESVKSLPKNELELTVRARDLGRVKVVVSPLEIQRVPGKGRQVRLRGVIIRQGRQGTVIRAMEMDPKDEGACVPRIAPMPVVVSFGFSGVF